MAVASVGSRAEFDLRVAPGFGADLQVIHVVRNGLGDCVSTLISRLKGLG
jgi:hypothetical protein